MHSLPLPDGLGSLYLLPDGPTPPRMRLLILPDWQGGLTAYAARMARLFGARLGARAAILHPYGPGIVPRSYEDEGHALVVDLARDIGRLHRLAKAAVDHGADLWKMPDAPLALVGFCFGGTLALEAARIGLGDVAVSIHGTPVLSMTEPRTAATGPAMHYIGGGGDALVPEPALTAFRRELQRSGRPGSVTLLGNAGHSFTKREVGTLGPYSRYSAPTLIHALNLTEAMARPLTLTQPEQELADANT